MTAQSEQSCIYDKENTMNIIEAWSKVSLSIKNDSRISDASRRAYIKTLVPLKEENNILYLMAPSLTNKKTVEVKYYDIIREHIQLITGKDYIINRASKAAHSQQKQRHKQLQIRQFYCRQLKSVGSCCKLCRCKISGKGL